MRPGLVPLIPPDPVGWSKSYGMFFGSDVPLPAQMALDAIDASFPYWWRLYNGTIGAQQTDRDQTTAQEDCWIFAILASSQQAAGFAAQFFAKENATDEGVPVMDDDLVSPLFAGTAQRAFYLRKPLWIPVGGQIESRIINLATVSNAIQVCGFGYRPDYRKKIT